jgi:hypothetical protein
MSTVHPDDSTATGIDVSHEAFLAVAVTTDRVHVLLALTRDAERFFGHGPLLVTGLTVSEHTTSNGTPAYLSSATFTISE